MYLFDELPLHMDQVSVAYLVDYAWELERDELNCAHKAKVVS